MGLVKRFKSKLIVTLGILILGLMSFTLIAYGQETTWVYDETDDLTEETLSYITKLNEEVFAGYELEPQIGIEILKALPEDNKDIDSYRNERFKELGVGNKEKDSGILLVIALEEREMGLEVGYGVEGVVRDIEADSIISGDMRYNLSNYMNTSDSKDLNKAIVSGVNEIESLLTKADTGILAEEREQKAREEEEFAEGMLTYITTFFGLVGVTVLAGYGYSEYKKKKKKEELKKLKEELYLYYDKVYDDELSEQAKNEMTKEEYLDTLINNFEEITRLETDKGLLGEYKMNRKEITRFIRIKLLKTYVKENEKGLKFASDVYLNRMASYNVKLMQDDRYSREEFIKFVNKDHEEKLIKVKEYKEKLSVYVAEDYNDYKEKLEKQGKKLYITEDKLYYHLLVNYGLVSSLLAKNKQKIKTKEEVEEDIKEVLAQDILGNTLENNSSRYESKIKYGNQSGLRDEIRINSYSDYSKEDLLNENKRNLILMGLLTAYVAREKAEYEAEIRKEEERRRRINSSSSSYGGGSSGSSFGGGFGGGSSGGGGASGGF